MASNTAKSAASSKTVTPQMAKASATAPDRAPESKPPGSKANSLLGSSLAPVTEEMRQAMIAEAAYYIAERRGFGNGHDVEDWLLAETQIDGMLSA